MSIVIVFGSIVFLSVGYLWALDFCLKMVFDGITSKQERSEHVNDNNNFVV